MGHPRNGIENCRNNLFSTLYRSHVKFIANFDLDDFPVAGNGSLPNVLNEINDENVNIAEIIVDWKLTKQKVAVFDMHNVYRNEIIPGESKQYGYVIHSSRRLFILHMR
ncbi:unnamed protein product [Haemonchus placei]|uniref:Glycosyltransferase family 92 protein n=1 Tax=Haemonchus placei TaxID=6290 RepID=A0A0N4VV92_HAEPC|nr:unnamed protein product [Haemonchus placei]